MNKEESAKIIGFIKTGFPYYYKDLNQKDMIALITLWSIQFRNVDFVTVNNALHFYISFGKYPPTIADIKEIIYNHSAADLKKEEAWDLVLKAGKNGRYGAKEEIEKLPEGIKQIVTADMLRRIADSTEYNKESIKKNFCEAYDKLVEQKKKMFQISMLPESTRTISTGEIKMLPGDKEA